MKITVTEFRKNIDRYLNLASIEKIIITKYGKEIAVLSSASDYYDEIRKKKNALLKSLFGCAATGEKEITLEEARDERLARQ